MPAAPRPSTSAPSPAAPTPPRRHILDVRCDPPAIARGVDHAGIAVSVELISWFHDRRRAGIDRALVGRVRVDDVEVEGRHDRREFLLRLAHHDDRVADLRLRVHHAAVAVQRPLHLDRVECGGEEVEQLGQSFTDEIGGDGVVSIGNGVHAHGAPRDRGRLSGFRRLDS